MEEQMLECNGATAFLSLESSIAQFIHRKCTFEYWLTEKFRIYHPQQNSLYKQNFNFC